MQFGKLDIPQETVLKQKMLQESVQSVDIPKQRLSNPLIIYQVKTKKITSMEV